MPRPKRHCRSGLSRGNDFYLGYTRDRSPGIACTDVKDRYTNGKARMDGQSSLA